MMLSCCDDEEESTILSNIIVVCKRTFASLPSGTLTAIRRFPEDPTCNASRGSEKTMNAPALPSLASSAVSRGDLRHDSA